MPSCSPTGSAATCRPGNSPKMPLRVRLCISRRSSTPVNDRSNPMTAPTTSVDSTTLRPAIASIRTGLLIGGQWRDAAGGRVFDVENPATGDVLAAVADADPTDGDAALAAAVGAQASWARTAP